MFPLSWRMIPRLLHPLALCPILLKTSTSTREHTSCSHLPACRPRAHCSCPLQGPRVASPCCPRPAPPRACRRVTFMTLSSSALPIPSSLGLRRIVNSTSPFRCHHAPCNSSEQDSSGAAGPGSPTFPGFPHNHLTCMSPNLMSGLGHVLLGGPISISYRWMLSLNTFVALVLGPHSLFLVGHPFIIFLHPPEARGPEGSVFGPFLSPTLL